MSMIKMRLFDGRIKEIPAASVPTNDPGLYTCVEVIGLNNESRVCFVNAEKCFSMVPENTFKNVLRAAALQARVAGLPGFVDSVTRDLIYFVPMGNTCLRIAARGYDEPARNTTEEE